MKRAAVVVVYGLGALAAAAAGFNEAPTDFQLWMMVSAAVLASVAAFASDQRVGPLQKNLNQVHQDAPGSGQRGRTTIKKTPNFVDIVGLVDIVDQVTLTKKLCT